MYALQVVTVCLLASRADLGGNEGVSMFIFT